MSACRAAIPYLLHCALITSITAHCQLTLQQSLQTPTLQSRSIAEASATAPLVPTALSIKFGIDNLQELRFEPLRGKTIALFCNAASNTRFGRHSVEVFLRAPDVTLRSILVPSTTDLEFVQSLMTTTTTTAQPRLYSLDATGRRPTSHMLEGCDAVVIDVQDVGIRSNTTLATLYGVLDACAKTGIEVIVLDRPNPLGGECVDGSIPDASIGTSGFTLVPVPYLHGMTIGELALMINDRGWLSQDHRTGNTRQCSLQVIKMRRWRRSLQWEQLRGEWVPISRHVPTGNALRGIALLGLIGELDTLSIGIGTDRPFGRIGSPTLNDSAIEACRQFLNRVGISTEFEMFTPSSGPFAGQSCRGLSLKFPADVALPYFSIGIELLRILAQHDSSVRDRLLQPRYQERLRLITGDPRLPAALDTDRYRSALEEFRNQRMRYMLYP